MKTLTFVASSLALSMTFACSSSNGGTGLPFGGRGGSAGSFEPDGTPDENAGTGGKSGRSGTGGAAAIGGATAGTTGQAGGSFAGAGGSEIDGPSAGVRAICDDYVACIASANPPALGPIADAYGKQGNCFDQGDEALCQKACKNGLVQAHGSYPKIAACNYCDSSKDCGKGAPACDTQTHTCKACSSDAHCESDAFPACDTATFTCVACNANVGCDANSSRPVCDVASHTCEACQSNDDCSAQAANGRGICGTSGKCRGCAKDQECAGGRCDVGQQRCVECLSDADCGGGTCDSFTNACCGAGLCESKGFVCGIATATGCGSLFGTPVSCGTCGGGDHCSDHQCVAPPPAGCPTPCGSGERCAYDTSSNTRLCVPRVVDCEKSDFLGCGKGYSCESAESKYPPFDRYYFCVAECLVDGDCPAQGGLPGKCAAAEGEAGLCTH